MINFLNNITKPRKEEWEQTKKLGLEEGIELGMKACFELTSELSETEDELLTKFLIRHNFVLCYDLQNGGFRVRKNNRINPQKEKVVSIIDDKNKSHTHLKTMPMALAELQQLQKEIDEIEKYSKEEREILGIF